MKKVKMGNGWLYKPENEAEKSLNIEEGITKPRKQYESMFGSQPRDADGKYASGAFSKTPAMLTRKTVRDLQDARSAERKRTTLDITK
jgi:hypothetical protein